MNTWNFRDAIISAANRWYWVVASFLIGAFLGWLVSYLWPAPYRATLDLYVGLNAYRATRDPYIAQVAEEEFRSLDDYKNWQMGQLNSLALSDDYLSETLTRLQAVHPAWQNADVPALRAMLSVAWRNTGDWHFRTEMDAPQLAAQTVEIWTQVVTEKVGQAVNAARELVSLDSELSAVSQALEAAETRQHTLIETQAVLAAWEVMLQDLPADQALTALEHGHLLSQVTNAAAWNLGWEAVLNAAPALGAQPNRYLDWLSQVRVLSEAELAQLPQEIEALHARHAELAEAYNLAANQSQALAANLEVQQIKAQPPQIVRLRPVGTLLLLGGLLGILTLVLAWLAQITRKSVS